MKSGDFPKSDCFPFPDDVEIAHVTVHMENVLLPKAIAGYRNIVYLDRANDVSSSGIFSYRIFRFPANTALVVKEKAL